MKIFKEVQRFDQWWLITLFVLVYAKITYDILRFFRETKEVNIGDLEEFIVPGIVIILVTILIFSLKLKSRIDENGISYQFFPIQLKAKNVPWESLKECNVRKYSPILEYGGWGFRGILKLKLFGLGKNGKAYNVRGNIGIQMVLKNGSKILVGTQEKEQAKQVLKNYSYKISDETRT